MAPPFGLAAWKRHRQSGSVSIVSGTDLTLFGRIDAQALGSGKGGRTDLPGCGVRIASGALIETSGLRAANELTGRESISVDPGAQLLSSAAGANLLRYRDRSAPRVVRGTVIPAPAAVLDLSLSPCAVTPSTTLPPAPTTTITGTTTTTIAPVTTTTLAIPAGCGDGIVAPGEQCEPRPAAWKPGMGCRRNCTALACGDADDSGQLTATDALRVLRIAVGVALDVLCPACS